MRKSRIRYGLLGGLLLAAGLVTQGLTVETALAQFGGSPLSFQLARKKLVESAIESAGVSDPRVLKSMRTTPRHEFVRPQLRKLAYFDMALPIGDQQTISSPFIVAYMTESLETKPTDKVLEIGTGSGYQAAVLSPLVKDVYTIEIVGALGRRAERTLKRLNYDNVHVRIGDGFKGWPEHAPFDKIIVTCSPEKVPQPLVEQLREGGLMVIPVGERYQQTLYLYRKAKGKLESVALRPTLFVPMTGTAEQGRVVKPDPLRPELRNGSFEEPPETGNFQPGWYYQRQLRWEEDPDAPDGDYCIEFHNDEPGQASHILQGFAIDGRKIAQFELSAWLRYDNVQTGRTRDESAMIVVTFYDENRRDLGPQILGPFRGTEPWHQKKRTIQVPPQTKEAIFRMGLFGATGEMAVDNVSIKPVAR